SGFEVYDEPAERVRPASATTDAALAWHRSRAEEDAPLFLWVHFFDPHVPYRPPREHAEAFQADDRLERYLAERRFHDEGKRSDPEGSQVVTRTSIDLYDGEIRYMDEQVGRLLGELRAHPRWRRTALVALAD